MDGAVVAWLVTAVVLVVLAAVLVGLLRRGRAAGAVSPIDLPRSEGSGSPSPPDPEG